MLKGRNTLSRAKTVQTFVVSPFIEWSWERGDRLWHDASTPRILQADEATRYLTRLEPHLEPIAAGQAQNSIRTAV
jgi:hypothetical protein